MTKTQYDKNNFLKKLLFKAKEHLMSDDIKNEIRNEIMEPFCVEIINFILPHYAIFMVLFLIIIIMLIYIIMSISSIKNNK